MDGVNNTFCMSKEEYEIARLATKCAGLQGKIDDQAAEIASLQETLDAVAKVASDAEKLVISQRDEIATLTAKLEAAEQDAARYRFWKDWWMDSEGEISQLPGLCLSTLEIMVLTHR